jgi:glycosyltransferase involved in cell wall biosynthesis
LNGLLISSMNPDDLARAVESLIADPARAKTLGAAGRAKANSVFSQGQIVPHYEALYRRVLGS